MAKKARAIVLGENPDMAIPARRGASDHVYEHVKRLILSGELKGGERIPEKVVAEHFQVSRTPVREALARLAEYGLVVIKSKPWSYAYVANISSKEAHDIFEVRLSLEKLAFRKFAQIQTPEIMAQLREHAARCHTAGRRGDYALAYEEDSLLHLGIAKATGNMELYNTLSKLDSKVHLVRANRRITTKDARASFDQHETLLDLLEKKAMARIDAALEEHLMHHLDVRETPTIQSLGE